MIDSGVVLVDEITISIDIREWDQDGTLMYDWITSHGDESDELFESAEEALDDARNNY